MSKTDGEMKVINICSTTKVVEPFYIGSSEKGLEHASLFPPRSVKSVQMFIDGYKPRMDALLIDQEYEAVLENFVSPVDNYRTLNGDGLLSVCMQVCRRDSDIEQHKICVYDHLTRKLKFLGNIPRHRFLDEFNKEVFGMYAQRYAEGVIAALTHDGRYVMVFAYSKSLMTMNVFDIWNSSCLLETDCSEIGFLRCRPNGVALNPQRKLQDQFQVALLNESMEVRLWETTARSENIAKLEDVWPCCGYRHNIINPRESTLKFTPNGQLLCVMAHFLEENTAKCIFLDANNLEPFCVMPYGLMCCDMYSMFPCFTSCGSKFSMLSVVESNDYWDFKKYRYLYFEIPPRMESLKELCKFTILKSVHISMLEKLPLPNDLITFLGGGNSSSAKLEMEKKRCMLM